MTSVNEESVFAEAQALQNPQERAVFLDRASAGNPEMRRNLESLLSAYDAGQFLEAPAVAPVATIDNPVRERPGTVIGPYKLLQQIGEGGMGTVFMAEQTHPVQRKVALKIIKPGMDSRQVIARFEAERQALAVMDHVNIARVFDGGATEAGRPYFVMELVHGVPITKYCDDNHLTPHERLELFVPVCQAIQHAHQKGIIHRDIKPSNVMITLYDGKPVPKVIDFGVAKATEQKLTERTLFTQYGAMVGTLEYMSPEQAEMSALGVDTRSDIYSLGVLLYELLTGSTPLTHKRIKEAAYAEILRMIKEEEPPRPSTRLSDSGEALASISANRHTEPAKLTKLVRGELDWIVMKTLEKDRNRRYETANGFAADVQRYLNDETVQACPPSAGYRLRKFARRNKGPVTAGLALAALLVLGTVGTSIGLAWALQAERAASAAAAAEAQQRQNAETQRDRARTAEQLATYRLLEVTKEKQRADEEAAIAKAVSNFLRNDVLAQAAPNKNARSMKVTVEQVLGTASARIAGKFEKQPRIEAAIRLTIGDTYRRLGDYRAAEPHLERVVDLLRVNLGEENLDTLKAMNNLAGLYHVQGLYHAQGQLAKAESLYVKVLEVRRRVLGDTHPDTFTAMNNVAGIYQAQGQFTKAEPLFVTALEGRRLVLDPEHPDTLSTTNNLGLLYQAQGRFSMAEPLLVKALEGRRRVLGENNPDTLGSMNNLGLLYEAQGRFSMAEPLLVKALEGRRRVLGDEHPDTLDSTHSLAMLYKVQRQLSKAEALLVETVAGRSLVQGPEHPDTLRTMNILAGVYHTLGQFPKAESLYVKTLEIQGRVLGEKHPDTLTSMSNLGVMYRDQRQYAKAEPLFVKTLEIRRGVLGEKHRDTLHSMNNLAILYFDQGQLSKAEPLFVEALEIRRVLAPEHPDTFLSVSNLAALYQREGEFAKAEPLCREILEKTRKRHKEFSPPVADALSELGQNLLQQKKHAEAESPLRECLKIREAGLPDDWTAFSTRSLLGFSLLGQKKYAEAEPVLLSGYEGMKQREASIAANREVRLAEALEHLVQLYDALGPKEKAAGWRKNLEPAKLAQQLWQDLLTGQQDRHRFVKTKYEGSLEPMKGKQQHPVEMKAGRTYVFDLESKAFDTFLVLEDGKGSRLAQNDDINFANPNSRIIYTAQTSGTYRIIATSSSPAGAGPYVLRIRELMEK
jgi:serine/threonine protein kinase/tetratricopeptide (TPR) repeat protein